MYTHVWETLLNYSVSRNVGARQVGSLNATDAVIYQDLYSGDWQKGIAIESEFLPYGAEEWMEVNEPPIVGEIVEWYAGFPYRIRAWIPQ